MSIIRYKTPTGDIKEISVIKGDKGDKGDTGDSPTITTSVVNDVLNIYSDDKLIGSIDSLASLVDGKIPESQLPSSVDDVIECSNFASFPASGTSGKIYIDTNTNKLYRWNSSQYVEVSPLLALDESDSTAYPGNKGKENADAIIQLQQNKQDKLTTYILTDNNIVYNIEDDIKLGYSVEQENGQIKFVDNHNLQDISKFYKLNNGNTASWTCTGCGAYVFQCDGTPTYNVYYNLITTVSGKTYTATLDCYICLNYYKDALNGSITITTKSVEVTAELLTYNGIEVATLSDLEDKVDSEFKTIKANAETATANAVAASTAAEKVNASLSGTNLTVTNRNGISTTIDTKGIGIQTITKTSTEGLVDTYTITLSNNTTSTFTVTNGQVATLVLTLDAYTSLETKDSNTLYIIKS